MILFLWSKGFRIALMIAMAITVGILPGCKGAKKENREAAGEPEEIVRRVSDSLPVYMVKGKQLYEQHCLVCHQATGGGVSGLNPPLRNTEYVLGDKERLILILLKGSNKGLVVNGMTYSNAMPGFPNLSNEEMAYITSYIRNSFGNSAEPVSISEVAQVREKS